MKKIILTLLFISIAQPQNFWEQTNGPFGGEAHGIGENSIGEILAGTNISDQHMYRSPDGGETWIKSDSGMVGFLWPENILMNSKGYIFTNGYSSSTYRSITNGRTWEILPMFGIYPECYSIHISENDNIYVGVVESLTYKLVKSTDDGATWINISDGINYSVDAITNIGDTLYIGTMGSGILKSTDDGETWFNLPVINSGWVQALTKNEVGELFASYDDDIIKSANGGITWVTIYSGFGNCNTILPDVQSNIFIAGHTIKRSSDGGNSWVEVYSGISTNYGESLYSSQSGDLFYTTFDAGIFKSSDMGDTWKQAGFNNSYIYDITFDEADDIYVTTPNKVFKSTDFGNTWKFSGNGMQNFTEIIHYTNNKYLWTGKNISTDLYFSLDNGESWNAIQGINGVSDINDNSLSDLFIATGDGLYCSSDNGLSWLLKRTGSFGKIYIDDEDEIYYGKNTGLEQSNDNGETWTTLLTDFIIQEIYVDKKGNIFVGNGYDDNGLLRSTDSGISWDTVSHSFVGNRIYAITGNSTNQLFCSAGKYGEREIYMSTDFGDNWSIVTSGIPSNTICLTLDFDSNGFIYAGTTHNSVFRSNSTTLDINEQQNSLPSECLLDQNYPNPFNPSTKIKFTIPNVETRHASSLQMISLKVYDVLGNEIATLVNEELSPGEYEVEFNTSSGSSFRLVRNLPSGIYFYTLKAGSFVQTKKMLLLK